MRRCEVQLLLRRNLRFVASREMRCERGVTPFPVAVADMLKSLVLVYVLYCKSRVVSSGFIPFVDPNSTALAGGHMVVTLVDYGILRPSGIRMT